MLCLAVEFADRVISRALAHLTWQQTVGVLKNETPARSSSSQSELTGWPDDSSRHQLKTFLHSSDLDVVSTSLICPSPQTRKKNTKIANFGVLNSFRLHGRISIICPTWLFLREWVGASLRGRVEGGRPFSCTLRVFYIMLLQIFPAGLCVCHTNWRLVILNCIRIIIWRIQSMDLFNPPPIGRAFTTLAPIDRGTPPNVQVHGVSISASMAHWHIYQRNQPVASTAR